MIRAHSYILGGLGAAVAGVWMLAPAAAWPWATAAIGAAAVGAAAWTGRARLKRLERQLEERTRERDEALTAAAAARAAKTEFVAHVSHEIRTPMTAILGYAELLATEEGIHRAPEQRQTSLQTIRRNSEHLLAIVNDLLDISRIEAGKMGVERIETDPGREVARVVRLMRAGAAEKGLHLRAEAEGELPETIRTDPVRLRQILMNLIGNAIKFTQAGSVSVRVGLERSDRPRLRVEVIDTGVGISAEEMGRLFTPFSQADSSMSRSFGGTGLGLAISRRLAQMLGGDVTARSEPGRGSTFTAWVETGPLEGVRMLAANLERGADPAAEDERPAARLSGRVLVAEDGADNQRLLRFYLERAGLSVQIAENGRLAADAAMQAVEQGRAFDLVLMDMQMPVMDGYEATRELRSRGYAGAIVAVTAHAMSDDRERCLAAGCTDYLTKPIDRKRLLDMCAAVTATASETVVR